VETVEHLAEAMTQPGIIYMRSDVVRLAMLKWLDVLKHENKVKKRLS